MPDNQLHHGDSREVLKTLPSASVDSVVTDPPAGLTGGALRIGRKNCLTWLFLQVHLPDFAHGDVQRTEEFQLSAVLRDSSLLDGEQGARIGAGVGVPEGTVHLKDFAQGGEPEVHDSREAASGVTKDELSLVRDSKMKSIDSYFKKATES